VNERGADRPVVTLFYDVVAFRPGSRDDAGFMAEASADPAIRRHNGVLDRLGRPAPPLWTKDAEAVVDKFVGSIRPSWDVGVAADMGLPWSLPQLVGSARARELMFLRGKFDSEEALDLGLVSEVYSPNEIPPGRGRRTTHENRRPAGVQRTGPGVEATPGILTRKRDPIWMEHR
jgi:hypothetical protein